MGGGWGLGASFQTALFVGCACGLVVFGALGVATTAPVWGLALGVTLVVTAVGTFLLNLADKALQAGTAAMDGVTGHAVRTGVTAAQTTAGKVATGVAALALTGSVVVSSGSATPATSLSMLMPMTATATQTFTPTMTATLLPTPTPTSTSTPFPTATPTLTLAPTATRTSMPTSTRTPTPDPGLLLATSFEDLSLVTFPGRNIAFGDCYQLAPDKDYAAMKLSTIARTGQYSLNAAPKGNPITDTAGGLSSAILKPIFTISGASMVTLKMWTYSTSNPKVDKVGNCGSALNVFYKMDSGSWTHRMAFCGSHKTETKGWLPHSLDFDVKGKSTIQFAFQYQAQGIKQVDPDVYFLIDDFELRAK